MGALKMLKRLLPSRGRARERLQMALVSDRADVPPYLLVCLKKDLLRVVGEYVELDESGVEFRIATNDGASALVVSIPISRLKGRWQPPESLAQ